MRLYRERSREDRERAVGMISKKEVRLWLEKNSTSIAEMKT
jgi:hypothetical protein